MESASNFLYRNWNSNWLKINVSLFRSFYGASRFVLRVPPNLDVVHKFWAKELGNEPMWNAEARLFIVAIVWKISVCSTFSNIDNMWCLIEDSMRFILGAFLCKCSQSFGPRLVRVIMLRLEKRATNYISTSHIKCRNEITAVQEPRNAFGRCIRIPVVVVFVFGHKRNKQISNDISFEIEQWRYPSSKALKSR